MIQVNTDVHLQCMNALRCFSYGDTFYHMILLRPITELRVRMRMPAGAEKRKEAEWLYFKHVWGKVQGKVYS